MFSPFTNVRVQKLIGVISGFQAENSPIRLGGKDVPNASTPTNTGIIRVTPIEAAIDLIKDYVEKQKTP